MRHRKRKGKLNRRTSWRKATLKSLTKDLFTYQRIETTMAKAKALRSYAEPIITLAKKNLDSVSARRQVFKRLCDKTVVKNLFDNLAPLYKDTNGGYTRIMGLGNRRGDGVKLAIIELTKRTISDEALLGETAAKETAKAKKKTKAAETKAAAKPAKAKKSDAADEKAEEKGKAHSAPEINKEEQEERVVENVKKEKAKREQNKVARKGLFKRFRRKSI